MSAPISLSPSRESRTSMAKWLKADGYGKICLDGKHYYSTRPENSHQKVLVGIYADKVDIL